MSFHLTDDIRSVTDLKRHTKSVLDQAHQTRRPVILTVNGKADAVLLDAKTYELHLSAANLAKLLRPAQEDVAKGRTRPAKAFLKEFKRAHKISG